MTRIEGNIPWKSFAHNVMEVAGSADSLWAKFHEGKRPSGPPSMDDCIKIAAREVIPFPNERSLIVLLLLSCWNDSCEWAKMVCDDATPEDR